MCGKVKPSFQSLLTVTAMYLQEGEVRVSMKVCNLQVAVDNLAASVEQPQRLIVVFQAGGQGQFHVRAQAHCNTQQDPGLTQVFKNRIQLNIFLTANINGIFIF